MKILIGADPEVFVMKDGTFLSAYGLIQGTKEDPFKVNRGAVQVDGMALEFNIDPAGTEDEFCLNIQSVFDTLRGMVPDYNVVATPVADFSEDYLKQQPEKALELGCDPDYNAWTTNANDRPQALKPMRTASGHVHIGWTEGESPTDPSHFANVCAAMKQMDFFLGLPSLVFDSDARRRELYGRAGACRPKSYGAEYRVLSNVWLNKESLIKWVYKNAMLGMNRLMEGDQLVDKFGDIQDIINKSDVKAANGIIKAANIPLPQGL